MGSSRVEIIFTVVVLPAQFGPRRPKHSPAEIRRIRSRTATIGSPGDWGARRPPPDEARWKGSPRGSAAAGEENMWDRIRGSGLSEFR